MSDKVDYYLQRAIDITNADSNHETWLGQVPSLPRKAQRPVRLWLAAEIARINGDGRRVKERKNHV